MSRDMKKSLGRTKGLRSFYHTILGSMSNVQCSITNFQSGEDPLDFNIEY